MRDDGGFTWGESLMSEQKDDGGPGPTVAFPDVTPMNGVTLRDWFAGMALQGIIITQVAGWDRSDEAEYAYACADAMLKARQA